MGIQSSYAPASHPPKPHKRAGYWHLARRVPKQYRPYDSRGMVIHSTGILITDDPHARAARPIIAEMDAELWKRWRELAGGGDADPRAKYQAAVETLGARGADYLPAAAVARLPPRAFADRLQLLSADPGDETPHTMAAVMGTVPVPQLMLSELRGEYETHFAATLKNKSPKQMRRWRTARDAAIATFMKVIGGDKTLTALTREDTIKLRNHWRDRVTNGEIEIDTANKNITRIASLLRGVDDIKQLGIPPIFEKLLLAGNQSRQRLPYRPAFVQDRYLADGALDALNEEARRIIFLTIETGLRPAEACNLNRATIILDHPIPHVIVRPDGREIKTLQSQRVIPLVGVALMAMRKHPDGFPRYHDSADTLSAAVGSFLRDNNLAPNGETLYSLRHMFKDRLRAARTDSELRNHLMGHKCKEPPYGFGWTLEVKAEILNQIAFRAPSRV